MSKAVLISILPNWVEKICSGEKTIEVRRTRPLIDMPFKVFVYETKAQFVKSIRGACTTFGYGRGKVIGEFICDKVDCYPYGDMSFPTPAYDGDPTVCECGNGYYITCGELEKTCLKYKDLENYGKSKTLYGRHISDLKIYDTPKELSDFSKYGYKYLGGCCVNNNCKNYVYNGYYQPPECKIDGCFLKRPPQSWMYVEELQ